MEGGESPSIKNYKLISNVNVNSIKIGELSCLIPTKYMKMDHTQ